ncbi:MAG: capsular exopolysaccharide synthesis family protein [Saprospiraceae bacterium]|jgi:capsular exopolysaccharide synthesis family protein
MEANKYTSYQDSQNKGQKLKLEITKYIRYWPFILGVLLFSLSVVFVQLRYTKKLYQSNAKIRILSNSKGLELPDAGFIFSKPNINLENNIEIIKSSKLWEELVIDLNLVTSFYKYGSVLLTEVSDIPFEYTLKIAPESITEAETYTLTIETQGLIISNTNKTDPQIFANYSTLTASHSLPFDLTAFSLESIKNNIGEVYNITLHPVEVVAARYRQLFSVSVVGKNSDLLQLSFKGEIKYKSEKILNRLVKLFELDGIRLRQKISKQTIDFIEERFIVLANELDSIETGIKDYKIANSMVSLGSKTAADILKFNLSEAAVVDLEVQFVALNFIKKNIKSPLDKLEVLPNFINEEALSVNSQIQAFNLLVFELERLKTSAGSGNPKFKLLHKQLEDLRQSLNISLGVFEGQLKNNKKELLAKNKTYNQALLAIPEKEMYMRDIERQKRIKETLYLFLLERLEEASINNAITETSMQVVEYASSYYDPISLNQRDSYTQGAIFGLAIPILIIYLMMFFDTKVKSVDDIKIILKNIPNLGELPKMKKDFILSKKDDNSFLSEAFRILSSNLSFMLPTKQNKVGHVVMSTSTIKGEGKTFTSINMAFVESNLGKRVLLVGADLRNPQIHKSIHSITNEKGLTNLLYNKDVTWKELIQHPEGYENLDIIPAGPAPPNAPQLLKNGKLEIFLEEAKVAYDLIIIDSAPTLLVTDTFLVTPYVDLTLFVLRYGYTDKALLNFIKDVTETGKIKNIATVLNGINQNNTYGYGYNYGYTNYGYSYGYGKS